MRNILFVCTGNTCRSPIAEALLRARCLDNVEVRSAGIYAMNGGNISLNGQLVLNNALIPFAHETTALDERLVDWADLILTMTFSHKQTIVQAFPHTKTKVYMYKEFVTPQNVQDVSDPYGGDLCTYENTFQEILALTDELVKRLRGD
ncbi:low molecular weight protein arginine phosphatase [Psychrobacillus glaciei]|uniref:Low molecular weight protein arginine phosphatase n=1 Tax=Psychrobacillus glaciei TaxID=2283160 RepID=A0A5J6SJT7_9BACI|nr:low molecular weight protein arginine phosphatase [Psychrobacillus glaciei]QFF97929.1 low molecular weight protein arginine phosphatase [Psychrobacillus glaciei]